MAGGAARLHTNTRAKLLSEHQIYLKCVNFNLHRLASSSIFIPCSAFLSLSRSFHPFPYLRWRILATAEGGARLKFSLVTNGMNPNFNSASTGSSSLFTIKSLVLEFTWTFIAHRGASTTPTEQYCSSLVGQRLRIIHPLR